MSSTSLTAIRTKVRRLTRSPSTQQISDADIDEYVNTFVLYDMPSHLRLSNLRKTFTFFTERNVDTYSTNTLDTDNPLYNFKNTIISTHDPIYVAGYKTSFSQSRESFFGKWPMIKQKKQIATGDNATTNFTGTLTNIPVLPNELMFTSIDSDGDAVGLTAVQAVNAVTGISEQFGNLYIKGSDDGEHGLKVYPKAVTGSVTRYAHFGYDDNNNYVQIGTSTNEESLVIETSGAVGINTTNPAYVLHVENDVDGGGIYVNSSYEDAKLILSNPGGVGNYSTVEFIKEATNEWQIQFEDDTDNDLSIIL